jgi:hypothetical protein
MKREGGGDWEERGREKGRINGRGGEMATGSGRDEGGEGKEMSTEEEHHQMKKAVFVEGLSVMKVVHDVVFVTLILLLLECYCLSSLSVS